MGTGAALVFQTIFTIAVVTLTVSTFTIIHDLKFDGSISRPTNCQKDTFLRSFLGTLGTFFWPLWGSRGGGMRVKSVSDRFSSSDKWSASWTS